MVVLRWVLAVVGGVVAYWIAMLMTLGVLMMALHVKPEAAAHSVPLLSGALGAGTFVAVFVAIAIGPPANRRMVGLVAFVAGAAWAIYGQIYAGNALGAAAAEAGAAIVGAGLAWLLASRLFAR
jgi:hypothetical protein